MSNCTKTGKNWEYFISWFGRRPWWSWLEVVLLVSLSAGLFVWSLSRNSMGNTYYAAAVKSGTLSWKAWFFGSFDSSSFITVDKLPASL